MSDVAAPPRIVDGVAVAGRFDLAVSSRFSLKSLNTHFYKPAQCADAYYIANADRANTMGIVFDWR